MDDIAFEGLVKIITPFALASFFLVIAFIRFAVKTVPENKRVIVFRFGKSLGSQGPGIVTILPIIDLAIWVDLEKTYQFRYSNLLTSDNQLISCAVTLEGKVTDPEKSVLNVPNLENSLSKIIETKMIDIARSRRSDELIQRRDWLEDELKHVIYQSSRSWGSTVTQLSIDDIRLASQQIDTYTREAFQIQPLLCSRCGGQLPKISEGTTQINCGYCETTFVITWGTNDILVQVDSS